VSRARRSAPLSNGSGGAKFSGAVRRRRGTPVLSRTSNRGRGSAAHRNAIEGKEREGIIGVALRCARDTLLDGGNRQPLCRICI